MSKEIDARGLSCPQPVLLTRKAMNAGEKDIVLLVNDTAARDNVQRLAENLGYEVQIEEKKNEFAMKIGKAAK